MVQKATMDGRETYVCEQCGFMYPAEDLAKACEEACMTKGVCRSDIAKQAMRKPDVS